MSVITMFNLYLNAMKKLLCFNLIFLFVLACDNQSDIEPEILDERQQLLNVMEFTAKAVSEITVNSDVRGEVLGYAKEEFDGEVTAHFNVLLNEQNKSQSATSVAGSFARSFEHKAHTYNNTFEENRSQSVDAVTSDLEAYLKEHNMALYGPYLAENHANSAQPITVSFDPLDETKVANKGFKLIPKSNQGSAANVGGLDAPASLDHYDLVEVENVDDTYAYENPTLFVIIDDGNTNIPNATGQTGSTQSDNRAIDCEDLETSAIVELNMPQFRLKGNLSSAPWARNILKMWAISGDDIEGFDSNGMGILNQNSSLLWSEKQVSRKNARKNNWLNPDIPFVESNWEESETDLVILIAFKERSIETKISFSVSSTFGNTSNSTGTVSTVIDYGKKFSELGLQNFNRCSVLANFDKDRGSGLHQGLRIFSYGGRLEFILKPYVN